MLEKDYLKSAACEKGKFRSFLLLALKRFLADDWDRQHAQKRGGFAPSLSIDQELALDRVWITGEGQAKLLDFPAPGLAGDPTANDAAIQSSGGFLAKVAAAALAGHVNVTADTASPVAVPLPLHARGFLEHLPQLPDADSVAGVLKPLLQRAARVTRWRRAAIVAGCLAGPVFFGLSFIWGTRMLEQWNRSNPGLIELNTVLQQQFDFIHRPLFPLAMAGSILFVYVCIGWHGQLARPVGPLAQRNGAELGHGNGRLKMFGRLPPFRAASRRSGQASGLCHPSEGLPPLQSSGSIYQGQRRTEDGLEKALAKLW